MMYLTASVVTTWLMLDSTAAYSEKVTTSQVNIAHSNHLTKLSIFGPSMSEHKFREALINKQTPAMEYDQLMNASDNGSPVICQLFPALFGFNPGFFAVNKSLPNFYARISQLERAVEQIKHIKQHGIVDFLQSVSYDPNELFLNITSDYMGIHRNLEFNVTQILSPVGVAHEVYMPFAERKQGRYRFSIKRLLSPFDVQCSGMKNTLVITLQEATEELNVQSTFAAVNREYDLEMDVSVQTTHLKPRKNHPCVEDRKVWDRQCLLKCMEMRHPCDCEYFPIRGGYPLVTNFSQICNHLQPGGKKMCPQLRWYAMDNIVYCETQCMLPCETIIYSSTTRHTKPQGKHMLIDVKFHITPQSVEVSEFYAYNIISYLCTLCATIALSFGYSFITFWKWLEEKWDTRRITMIQ